VIAQEGFDRLAKVLDRMKAVHDLHGVWRSSANALGVQVAPITTDDGDRRMFGEPSRDRRRRATLLEHRAAPIQHMQKALQEMNVQLTHVLTEITGTTGLAMIRAIVGGERDPVQLARFRHRRCASSAEEIAKALTGHYQPEHVFALRQALALYDFCTDQLRECDAELERRYQAMKPTWPGELPPLERADKRASHSKNAPPYDARTLLYQLTGVDLIAIPACMPAPCKPSTRKLAWICTSGPT
jgi:hypothetical protein